MSWLTSLSDVALVVGWLLFAIGVAFLSRWLVRVLVPLTERDHIPGIAAPLMPAMGATFAVLMALTLASEAGYLRSAQDLVSNEAAQASRLAWAATSPGVDTAPVQAALVRYLGATQANEWQDVDIAEDSDPATSAALATSSASCGRGRAARGRLAHGQRAAGLAGRGDHGRPPRAPGRRPARDPRPVRPDAPGQRRRLIVNGGALTYRSGARTSSLVLGLAVVVGLSMALLFALSGHGPGRSRSAASRSTPSCATSAPGSSAWAP